MSLIALQQEGSLLRIRLNRPEVRNALNDELIRELSKAFERAEQDQQTRVVILSGQGGFFCAGADLSWLQSFAEGAQVANEEGARRFSRLLFQMDRFPKPLIVQVQGAAIGGGLGLVSVADIAIAVEETVFLLAEVKLGLVPAIISPYLIAKIGRSAARRYFLTGERLQAEEAQSLGLIHEVVEAEDLGRRTLEIVHQLLEGGPQAIKICKELICKVSGVVSMEIQDDTIKTISELPATPEAQEGMKAFLEKRRPSWQG